MTPPQWQQNDPFCCMTFLQRMRYNAFPMGWKTPKTAPFLWDFVGHRQHAQKIGKDRTCGSRDILADRQTDRLTDRPTWSSQYFANASAGEVINSTDTLLL